MTLALRVKNLSKQYRIYDRPGDRLTESITRGYVKRHREFWALRDVSFEIEAGTTTGIIGPNGSGKSTLLQIITGTLEPTHGSVFHDGRIAALLELGAGFNPEFTGIENVQLSASLIGLSRNETRNLLPEIERFAEIGDFIHQPVKTFSSGMYVRLAFATAISTNPEILIVDEALAVGDVVFQHRCMRRIKELQESGTTILFVSHEPAAIRALCSRAILLNAGRAIADGTPTDVLNRYQELVMEREEAFESEHSADSTTLESAARSDAPDAPLSFTYRHGDGGAEIIGAELLSAARRRIDTVESGEELLLRMRVRFHRDIDEPVLGFLIRNRHGIHAYGTNTEVQRHSFGTVRRGEVIEVTFAFNCWLGIDNYSFTLNVHSSIRTADGVSYDWIDGVLFFRVTSAILIEGISNLNASAVVRRTNQSSGNELQPLVAKSDGNE